MLPRKGDSSWRDRVADNYEQFFRVFHDGAAVPIRCYQAAVEEDGRLRGWFQPQAGYELQDGDTVSIWTPVIRGGRPAGQASAVAVVDNNGGGAQWTGGKLRLGLAVS
jgi:hypothetical protein